MTIALERPVGTTDPTTLVDPAVMNRLVRRITTDPTTLVDPAVMNRLVRRITTDHPEINEDTARRIVGQAAAFIATSGKLPGRSLVPSELVDYGWHAFILHTVDYARFCQTVVGRFVHHVPTDEGEEMPGDAYALRERTARAIQAAGYTIDAELWRSAADCTQCQAGCHDSPKSG